MVENIKNKIEDKIIDLIALGAGGRLVVFKPEKSLGRTGEANRDLVIEKRSAYKKKVIFLNIYDKEILGNQNLSAEENFYLLFIDFNIVKQDIEDNFWLVPSLQMENVAGEKDLVKFSTNKKDFIRFLIETVE